MKPKKKTTASTLSEQRRKALEFVWHLRPPWRARFDRSHWWGENVVGADQTAAVWEVLRRHPRSKKLLDGEGGLFDMSPAMEFFIWRHGCLSWTGLATINKHLQEEWSRCLSELPPQRGVFRNEERDVVVIENEEIRKLGMQYWEGLNPSSTSFERFDKKVLKRAQILWNKSAMALGSITSGSNADAFLSLSTGRVLIGFDPIKPGIENLVLKKVKQLIVTATKCKQQASRQGRSSWKIWLKVIAKFEQSESSRPRNEKRSEKLFTSYRRIIKAWKWPSPEPDSKESSLLSGKSNWQMFSHPYLHGQTKHEDKNVTRITRRRHGP